MRVLLVGLPGILRSIIRETLAQQPDMCVVEPPDDSSEAPHERKADVILATIAFPHSLERAHEWVTATNDEPKLIGITPDGRHVVVFLTDLSPQDLVHTIRETVSVEETHTADSTDTPPRLAKSNAF
jgi:DNA-binding NarL/FixJ family response regulator